MLTCLAERTRANASTSVVNSSTEQREGGSLETLSDTLLSRFVAARLDLPVSQQLIAGRFRISIVKRCWEDQLRLKRRFSLTK